MSEEKQKTQQIKVRYNETTAQYASQFIINTGADEVIVNFSSGPIADPGSGEMLLPIHTRIALTKNGVQRLHAVLGSILQQQNEQQVPDSAQGQLPKIQ